VTDAELLDGLQDLIEEFREWTIEISASEVKFYATVRRDLSGHVGTDYGLRGALTRLLEHPDLVRMRAR